MTKYTICILRILLPVITVLFLISCSEIIDSSELDDSLEDVEEVTLIAGADNITITVNKGDESYFSLGIEDMSGEIESMAFTLLGWCIDWQTPIDSNGGIYSGVKAYSTLGVKSWNRINYILNNTAEIRESFPGISFREIQLVIWSLRGNPEFNLDDVELGDLPPEFHENGNPLFDENLVRDILNFIEENHTAWSYSEGDFYAVILETPADVQTLITVVR